MTTMGATMDLPEFMNKLMADLIDCTRTLVDSSTIAVLMDDGSRFVIDVKQVDPVGFLAVMVEDPDGSPRLELLTHDNSDGSPRLELLTHGNSGSGGQLRSDAQADALDRWADGYAEEPIQTGADELEYADEAEYTQDERQFLVANDVIDEEGEYTEYVQPGGAPGVEHPA